MTPEYKPLDYALAYGRLSGLIQFLAVRAKFAKRPEDPGEIDLKAEIERAALEERKIAAEMDAQLRANMETLKL